MNTREVIKKYWNLIAAWKVGHELEYYDSKIEMWVQWPIDLLPLFKEHDRWRIKTPKF